MIDETEMLRLRETPADIPPLDRVIVRGRRIRRRRLAYRGFGGFAVAAALVGAATVVTGTGGSDAVEVAAPLDMAVAGGGSDEGRDCGGFAELRSADDAQVPRFLPEWLPPGMTVEHAWARAELTEARTCPPVPVALVAVAADAGGKVSAAVRLEGPSPEPYQRYSGPQYESVTTRGDSDAALVRFPAVDDGYRQLQWTDPADGTSWSLTSYGLEDGELFAVASALALDGTGSSPVAQLTTDVAGLKELWALAAVPGDLPPEEPFWHVVVDGGTVSIDVNRPIVPFPAVAMAVAPDSRIVTVRGQTGVVQHDSTQTSITWNEGDVSVRVAGTPRFEDLLRIAESLEPSAPDDARISSP